MYSETITTQPAISSLQLLEELDKISGLLKEHIEEEQKERRISPEVFNALRDAGFLRLFLPKSLGGLETDPLTAARLLEEVARHNTSAGWAMMVANTAT